jgi:hypothetical protein
MSNVAANSRSLFAKANIIWTVRTRAVDLRRDSTEHAAMLAVSEKRRIVWDTAIAGFGARLATSGGLAFLDLQPLFDRALEHVRWWYQNCSAFVDADES